MKLSQFTSILFVVAMAAGCSSASPTDADINAAQSDDEYWEKRYEQQCINSGIRPGTPMLLKCVEDLMDIRAEQPDG